MEDCMTAHIDTQEAPEEGYTNVYNEQQWPHNVGMDHWAARLTEAAYATCVIARLLRADREQQDQAKDGVHGLEPFNANIIGGLFAALSVCATEISVISDHLVECQITRKA